MGFKEFHPPDKDLRLLNLFLERYKSANPFGVVSKITPFTTLNVNVAVDLYSLSVTVYVKFSTLLNVFEV